MNTATLNLFNTLPVDKTIDGIANSEKILSEFGCVVSNDIMEKYGEEKILSILDESSALNKINNTFFTILQTLETSDAERCIRQAMHYLSTYGYKAATGNRNENPYFPTKDLFPKYTGEEDSIYVRIITGSTVETIKKMVVSELQSNSGVNHAHQENWTTLVRKLFKDKKIAKLLNDDASVNRDLRSLLATELYPDFIPLDVEDMIRVAINIATNTAIKINSYKVLSELRASKVLDKYLTLYGIEGANRLSTVWRRNRKYLLVMKGECCAKNKALVNKARKLSNKNYSPIQPHPVFNATTMDDLDKFKAAITKVTVPQVIKVINACRLRDTRQGLMLVRIRNGSLFCSDKKLRVPKNNSAFLKIAIDEIGRRKPLANKKVFLPVDADLKTPTSAKDMIGNIPNFSSVNLAENGLAAGVHWYNDNDNSVDLDLSYTSMSGETIGWNSEWKDPNGITFSGDITDAPKNNGGAAEFIAISTKKQFGKLSLCLYGPNPTKLPSDYSYTMFLNKPQDMKTALKNKNDYLLNNSRTVFEVPVTINARNSVLGYLLGDKLLVTNLGVGGAAIAGAALTDGKIINYLKNNLKTKFSIAEYIEAAGGEITTDKTKADISLDFTDLNSDNWNMMNIF